MSVVSRAVRNVVRARARSVGVAVAVGIALSAFLILSQIDLGVNSDLASARAAVADLIDIEPAGGSGFFDPSAHLPNGLLPTIDKTPEVLSAQRILIESPGFSAGNGSGGRGNFSLYQGVDTYGPISSFGGFGGGSSVTITLGRTLDAADENASVALVGTTYASDHNVIPGSTISVNGSAERVVGIFSTGSNFGSRNIILPYPAAQSAFAASGPSLISVTVSSSADLDAVLSDLRNALGSNVAVTAPSQSTGGAFGSAVDSILSSTQFESYTALAIGAAVMVVVMALVTAQRTREIGLLKAFGFPNGRILSQLALEGLTLSLIGLPIGLVATVGLGPSVAQLVANSSSAPSGGGGRFFGNFASRLIGGVSFSITPEILALGIAVTFAFGLIGSLYPILRALRLKPAEAVRRE